MVSPRHPHLRVAGVVEDQSGPLARRGPSFLPRRRVAGTRTVGINCNMAERARARSGVVITLTKQLDIREQGNQDWESGFAAQRSGENYSTASVFKD